MVPNPYDRHGIEWNKRVANTIDTGYPGFPPTYYEIKQRKAAEQAQIDAAPMQEHAYQHGGEYAAYTRHPQCKHCQLPRYKHHGVAVRTFRRWRRRHA
jgi:hypothetical protein